jgi:hypothetical protein
LDREQAERLRLAQENAMITLTTLLAAAALSAGTVPTAPVAAAVGAVTPVASPVAKSSSRYAVRYDQKRDRYCVRDGDSRPLTGTMLSGEQCRTRNDWALRGLELSRKP